MKYDYTDLLENLCDGLYFTDHDRKIAFWNKAAEKITGFTAGEVVGLHCSDNILIHIDGEGNSLLFTDISAQAVMRAKIEELEKRALLDGLTQIANRCYVEMELESRLAEMKRYGLSFGVLF